MKTIIWWILFLLCFAIFILQAYFSILVNNKIISLIDNNQLNKVELQYNK